MTAVEERFNKPRRARSPSVGAWPSALSFGNARWWATTLRREFLVLHLDHDISQIRSHGRLAFCLSVVSATPESTTPRTQEGQRPRFKVPGGVHMGRAALLGERNEDVSHFDPLQSRKYSRTPDSRCKLWPSNSFPELETSVVLRVANRQTRPPGLRATACGLCISGVSPERGSGKFQDQAS